MGRELKCRAKIGGKWVEGKALLETSEVIFRGEARLKVPIAKLTSVTANKGQLYLAWVDQSALIELGEQADKWAHAILHPKSTAQKLGIKPGLTISALNMPADTTMSDARKSAKAFGDGMPLPGSDMIFFGATTASDLTPIKKLLPSLAPSGALWIVYPKGQKDIHEMQVLNAGRAAGLHDIKVASYSATRTALKFVRPRNAR
jgi:hypothetical protein